MHSLRRRLCSLRKERRVLIWHVLRTVPSPPLPCDGRPGTYLYSTIESLLHSDKPHAAVAAASGGVSKRHLKKGQHPGAQARRTEHYPSASHVVLQRNGVLRFRVPQAGL